MKNLTYGLLALLSICCSCRKLIEVGTPQNQLTTDKVFADSSSAIAALVNVYTIFNSGIDPNYNKFMSVYTDDMGTTQDNGDEGEFLTSQLSSGDGAVGNFWANSYSAIYACNLVIEQLQAAPNISAKLAGTLTAEAKFLRAYAYFYLVNSFGPVPLIVTTNVAETAKAARTDTSLVYAQMLRDLRDAQNALPASYTGDGKVRANKWAATALLARAYLYERNWPAAETQASAVINSGTYTLDPLSSVFLANSSETILSFWTQNGFIADAADLIPRGVPIYPLSANLVGAFEKGDLRKMDWMKSEKAASGGVQTTFYYPYKYHNRTINTAAPEYLVALRLGEQYLIRAEARAEQGNLPGAVEDLNVIRQRAGLPALQTAFSQEQCLAEAGQEWRSEFFAEWGHRFLELKRTGRLDPVMDAYKPTWTANAAVWPIPQSDLSADPFLSQNAGY